MNIKGREEIKEAQKILDGEIMKLNGSIKSKVDGYKDEKYSVQKIKRDVRAERA